MENFILIAIKMAFFQTNKALHPLELLALVVLTFRREKQLLAICGVMPRFFTSFALHLVALGFKTLFLPGICSRGSCGRVGRSGNKCPGRGTVASGGCPGKKNTAGTRPGCTFSRGVRVVCNVGKPGVIRGRGTFKCALLDKLK